MTPELGADYGSAVGAVFGIIGLVALGFSIYVIIDMARRPTWQWDQSRSNKVLWIVLQVVLLVFTGFGAIITGIIYMASIRPRLVEAERGGPPGYGQWGSSYSGGSPAATGPWGPSSYPQGPYQQGPYGGPANASPAYGAPPSYGAPPASPPSYPAAGYPPPYPTGGSPPPNPTSVAAPSYPPAASTDPQAMQAPGSSEAASGPAADAAAAQDSPSSSSETVSPEEAASKAGGSSVTHDEPEPAPEPASEASATAASAGTQESQAEDTAPASWQPDPSGRHEFRYWDGSSWTEHVADRGQQSTDPPVP